MSLLSSIFDNPAIKDAAFGQLKKLIKSENLGLIVVRLDTQTDELLIDMYKPGEAELTIKTSPEPVSDTEPEKINNQ